MGGRVAGRWDSNAWIETTSNFKSFITSVSLHLLDKITFLNLNECRLLCKDVISQWTGEKNARLKWTWYEMKPSRYNAACVDQGIVGITSPTCIHKPSHILPTVVVYSSFAVPSTTASPEQTLDSEGSNEIAQGSHFGTTRFLGKTLQLRINLK